MRWYDHDFAAEEREAEGAAWLRRMKRGDICPRCGWTSHYRANACEDCGYNGEGADGELGG